MPRPLRNDAPGTWHHVMNRSVGRRPLFETRREIDVFFDRLGESVRRGGFEIHAFAVLTTHFHLLVRSLDGGISATMRRVQDGFARWFNETRSRDGPLFRGRFLSKIVDSNVYWRTLVHYIDRNAVEAGIVSDASDYHYASARHYLTGEPLPWLERGAIESFVGERTVGDRFAAAYRRIFALDEPSGAAPLFERGGFTSRAFGTNLDDLVRAAPEEIQAWMRDRARLADGIGAGQRLVRAAIVVEEVTCAVAASADRQGEAQARGAPGRHEPLRRRNLLLAALLRLLSGDSYLVIAERLGVTESTAQRLAAGFQRRCDREDLQLIEESSRIIRAVLLRAFGEVPQRSPLDWSATLGRSRNGRSSRATRRSRYREPGTEDPGGLGLAP